MSNWTYINGEKKYNVELLNYDAKTAFNHLVEVQAEIQMLRKKVVILEAASMSLNSSIQSNLTEDALIVEETEENLLTEEEEVSLE
tara:strand:- start:2848 stop:3105 length:258 start_codon:yes stop_codon:yes gene_type:complete